MVLDRGGFSPGGLKQGVLCHQGGLRQVWFITRVALSMGYSVTRLVLEKGGFLPGWP